MTQNLPRPKTNQTSILRKWFTVHGKPNKTAVMELALKTGLHPVQVNTWFRNQKQETKGEKFLNVFTLCTHA